jgi:hypothetical protein
MRASGAVVRAVRDILLVPSTMMALAALVIIPRPAS